MSPIDIPYVRRHVCLGGATAHRLQLCPLELGPHLRLRYLDQPEGSRGTAIFPRRPQMTPRKHAKRLQHPQPRAL